jgi:hypothetical protein
VAAIERALARKVAVERGDEDPWSPYHLGPANPAPGGTRRADLADLTLGEALLSKGPITLIDQIGVVPGPHGILPHGVGTPDFRIVSFSGGPASVELGQEVIAFRRDVESLVRSFDMLRNMGRTLDFPNVAAALGVREALTAADIEGVQRELATVDQTKHGQVSRANVALGFAAALLGAAPLGWIALGLVLDGKSLANPYGIVVLSGLLAHHPGSLDVWHEHLQGVVRVSGDARDPATRACITSIIESLGRDPM